jgi:hypothetical protein
MAVGFLKCCLGSGARGFVISREIVVEEGLESLFVTLWLCMPTEQDGSRDTGNGYCYREGYYT